MSVSRPSYTWLIEHLAGMTDLELQDWIAGISYVPRAHVPLEICDPDFAYHWYRYVTRLADQERKRLDDVTMKLVFEMFAEEQDTLSRIEILRKAHREANLKLIPSCEKRDRFIAQHTTRARRAGEKGRDGISVVVITVYKRRHDTKTDKGDYVASEGQVRHA